MQIDTKFNVGDIVLKVEDIKNYLIGKLDNLDENLIKITGIEIKENILYFNEFKNLYSQNEIIKRVKLTEEIKKIHSILLDEIGNRLDALMK